MLISAFGALCFSTKAVLVKLAYRDYPTNALELLALRMLFSLPFFAVAAIRISLRQELPKSKVQWLAIVGTGLLGYHISSLLDFAGLQHISAGLERLVLFSYPTMVLLMSAFFLHEKVSGRQWLAVVVSYIGISLAFLGEYQSVEIQTDLLLGVALVFGCAITYGSYILIGSRIISKTGSSVFNSFSMLAACFGVLIHAGGVGSLPSADLPAGLWGYGLLMAVLSTVIPSYLISESLRRIGASNTAIIASIGPVSTIFMAWWLLDEQVTLLQLAGTAAILIGVWLIAPRRNPTIKA